MIQNPRWRQSMIGLVESELSQPIDISKLSYDELERLEYALADARIAVWRRNRSTK